MSKPKVAQTSPIPMEVVEGTSYFWCSCGESQNQPFCDGSHKDTEFQPMKYTAEKTGMVFFCGCKATGKSPLCDGSHNSL